jgi:hypothetical protein
MGRSSERCGIVFLFSRDPQILRRVSSSSGVVKDVIRSDRDAVWVQRKAILVLVLTVPNIPRLLPVPVRVLPIAMVLVRGVLVRGVVMRIAMEMRIILILRLHVVVRLLQESQELGEGNLL